jgi:hypothetical protein
MGSQPGEPRKDTSVLVEYVAHQVLHLIFEDIFRNSGGFRARFKVLSRGASRQRESRRLREGSTETSRSFSASAKSPSRPALRSAARSRYRDPSGFLRGLGTFLGLRSVARSLVVDWARARFGGAIPKREVAGALDEVGERPWSEERAGVASSERNAS